MGRQRPTVWETSTSFGEVNIRGATQWAERKRGSEEKGGGKSDSGRKTLGEKRICPESHSREYHSTENDVLHFTVARKQEIRKNKGGRGEIRGTGYGGTGSSRGGHLLKDKKEEKETPTRRQTLRSCF